MSETILVIGEQRQGQLNPQSLETVVAGQGLAEQHGLKLVVALLGGSLADAAAALGTAAVDRLLLVEDELLEPYSPDAYVQAARALLAQLDPRWVFMPHTYQARDFAPALAAGYQRSLISDCVNLRAEDGQLVFERPVFQGKMQADVVPVGDPPYFASFQAAAFAVDDLKRAAEPCTPETISVALDPGALRVKSQPPAEGAKRDVDLTQADIIVSVGRGIQGEENIGLARELAAAIGGELGASRPVVDEGWLPSERQVGSSGQTVAPKLYLAIGISGASQHLVGMKGAQTIVAVNKDAKAPIFKVADYGVVGDALELVPEITKALKG